MSHTTTLKTTLIRDITALEAAVADLKAAGVDCDLLQNVKPRMYFGNQHGECDYVLKLHRARYDVGFDKQADGSYVPVYDEFMGEVGKQIGAKACPLPRTAEGKAQHQIGQLMQNYGRHAAINAAVAQGYYVESTVTDDAGNVHITLGGMS